jgi:hypothetical protein
VGIDDEARRGVVLDQEGVLLQHHDPPNDMRCSVSLPVHGCVLQVFFEDMASAMDGPVLEARVFPESAPVDSWIDPTAVAYARAFASWRMDDARSLLRALRQAGATRRGLRGDFYRLIADQYKSLVANGERFPVTALADAQSPPVTVSTASRWIKECRRRKLLPSKPKRKETKR